MKTVDPEYSILMRSMPEDYSPEIRELDGSMLGIQRCGAREARLCFVRTGDSAADDQLLENLKQALWQVSEAVRLGCDDIPEDMVHALN